MRVNEKRNAAVCCSCRYVWAGLLSPRYLLPVRPEAERLQLVVSSGIVNRASTAQNTSNFLVIKTSRSIYFSQVKKPHFGGETFRVSYTRLLQIPRMIAICYQ
jgi:hypothetical protein